MCLIEEIEQIQAPSNANSKGDCKEGVEIGEQIAELSTLVKPKQGILTLCWWLLAASPRKYCMTQILLGLEHNKGVLLGTLVLLGL